MRSSICSLPIVLLGLPGPVPGQDNPYGRLDIVARPARVEIAEAVGERRLVSLPAMEFPISVRPECGAGGAVERIWISASDTQLVILRDDLGPDGTAESVLRLPRDQLAPVGLAALCVQEGAEVRSSVIVPHAYSAHASLLCAGDSGQRMIYETLSLGVELSCRLPEAAVAPGSETVNQAPPGAPSTSF